MSTKIFLYDTTLRDGAQSEDVNLSATDKVRIARQLDYLGMAPIRWKRNFSTL